MKEKQKKESECQEKSGDLMGPMKKIKKWNEARGYGWGP